MSLISARPGTLDADPLVRDVEHWVEASSAIPSDVVLGALVALRRAMSASGLASSAGPVASNPLASVGPAAIQAIVHDLFSGWEQTWLAKPELSGNLYVRLVRLHSELSLLVLSAARTAKDGIPPPSLLTAIVMIAYSALILLQLSSSLGNVELAKPTVTAVARQLNAWGSLTPHRRGRAASYSNLLGRALEMHSSPESQDAFHYSAGGASDTQADWDSSLGMAFLADACANDAQAMDLQQDPALLPDMLQPSEAVPSAALNPLHFDFLGLGNPADAELGVDQLLWSLPFELKLFDSVAIVTGGARGLGAGIVAKFLSEGARCVVFDWDVSPLSDPDSPQRLEPGRVKVVQGDVAKVQDWEKAVEAAKELGRLSIVVNCAGVCNQMTPTHDCGLDELDRLIGVNLKGVFASVKAVIPYFLAEGIEGNFVNITSASKAAANAATKSLALEYAPNRIRFNAVAPVMANTRMLVAMTDGVHNPAKLRALGETVPLGRLADPEDIANIVAHLACSESSFLTGQIIAADGGRCI
ncbi:hypothetical protein JCM10207_003158 [Rhodosporidiobolus poonsookiae]